MNDKNTPLEEKKQETQEKLNQQQDYILSEKDKKFIKRKNIRKVIRTMIESLLLILLLWVVIKNIFIFTTYQPFDEKKVPMSTSEKDAGFIALSYFGIARESTDTLVSEQTLDKHLQALYNSGYVTISQQDILDYYKEGKKLPQKALFLMFEDGRRDTTIFAEKVTEKYNDLSTIMTYANKFEDNDPTFLQPKDVKSLEKSSYWEFGTNGYRLAYINAFDRYNRFLGELDTKEYIEIHDYLGRDYDHYLMDYIRDEYKIPTESYDDMVKRINADYSMMENVYLEKLGKMPQMYVLMHSNTGMFGENKRVSEINEANIYQKFQMNCNREGSCLNTLESSIYNLTRIQPQPYWKTNHLLMRIFADTNQDVAWCYGDEAKGNDWTTTEGVAEFNQNEIYLTCEPEKYGTLLLNNSEDYKNIVVQTELKGNALGKQTVHLRVNKELDNYLSVSIENKILYLKDKKGNIYYQKAIDEIKNLPKVSVEEDSKSALLQEKETSLKYADSKENAEKLALEIVAIEKEKAQTVEEGAKEYVPALELKEAADYHLKIQLQDDIVTVYIDDILAIDAMKVNIPDEGSIEIQSGWGGDAYSQRNLSDDVYDGVFKDICITSNSETKNEVVLYDNRLHGIEKILYQIQKGWRAIVNFFINTF